MIEKYTISTLEFNLLIGADRIKCIAKYFTRPFEVALKGKGINQQTRMFNKFYLYLQKYNYRINYKCFSS